jgi:hypothetical protein
MKTLAHEGCEAEIVRRLRTVRHDSTRRFGRMSAHQMVCHLSDGCRMATGGRRVTGATGPFKRTLVKWIVLYLPLRWPAGIPTSPEIDQECGGTRPVHFAADVAELEALLELMTTREEGAEWSRHPVFGRMSRAAWLRWAYLHTDHHLRQFGA